MKFRGVLVRLDEASTKAPHGSDGHRILVPTEVAKSRLSSLISMGLNYAADMGGHNQKRKVGVIEKAWIDGKDLRVEGTIWKHDFPEAQQDLKQKNLGMSMELGDVHVEDPDSEIWTLSDFFFTGATILYKDKAAYYKTAAIAAAAEVIERSNRMAVKVKAKKTAPDLDAQKVAEIAATAAVEAVSKVLGPTISRQSQALKQQTQILAGLATRVEEMELSSVETDAKGKKEDEEEEEDEEAAAVAAKKEEDEEEEDEEAAAVTAKKQEDDDDDEDGEDDEDDVEGATDTGDLEKMGPKTKADDEDEVPGEFNKAVKNKGNKTTSEDEVGADVNKSVLSSAVNILRKQVKKLTRAVQAGQEENSRLKSRLEKYGKQVTAASAEITRRSLPPELIGLLAKQSINADDLRASGTKLSAEEFDGILRASGVQLDVTKRIEMKNLLCKFGVMDEGRINRGQA